MLVGDVTGGNNMACLLKRLYRCGYNGLTMQGFGQNTILLFNEPTTCFGYDFVTIVRAVPRI
jgi:hypothetical protein